MDSNNHLKIGDFGLATSASDSTTTVCSGDADDDGDDECSDDDDGDDECRDNDVDDDHDVDDDNGRTWA